MRQIEKITPFAENPTKWYIDVIKNGNLISYGPFKGSIILKPLAYSLWTRIQEELGRQLRQQGVEDVYLPLLIPDSYIRREQHHIAGFNPELATVTHVGGRQLAEPLYIRPTSETLFGELFREEVRSYHDLPLLYNQWVNVVRWEKTTTPLLRNSEFLWQEGHTLHAGESEAAELSSRMINIYQNFLRDYLALPSYTGKKTIRERFAGADITYSVEILLRDGRALQSATSHMLGTNFTRAFNITYKDEHNQEQYPYQTSWGTSTRLLGAIIMNHGDDRGIIIPPNIAYYKIDITTWNPHGDDSITKRAEHISRLLELHGINSRLDDSGHRIGYKAAESEISGTPLRIEIGAREVSSNAAILIRRDTLAKRLVSLETLVDECRSELSNIQDRLLEQARIRMEEHTVYVRTYQEFSAALDRGCLIVCHFAGTSEDERRIQEETGASARVMLTDDAPKIVPSEGRCIITNTITQTVVLFARAY